MTIDNLAEHFKHLELKLGERGRQSSQPPRVRATMYCIMCGQSGHGIQECLESKFFISQDICRMDVNNRVVMSDGTTLPCTDGEGGVAKQIHSHLTGNAPSGPTSTSASNVEVVAAKADYEDESNELAVLGSMEFEVLPVDRLEKSKRSKPYDRPDMKKGVEKTTPETILCPRDPQPNCAYVELPPTILKHMPPAEVPHPSGDDQEMMDAVAPVPSKGKLKEIPVVVPTLIWEPEVTKLRVCASVPKEMPRFEVVNPKFPNEKMKNQAPQYKYATELMNETNQEGVFHNIMDQLVTLKLGELLGTSYDLG